MEAVQKKVIELHKIICKELEDPALEPVLRAHYLVFKKECEALDWALRALITDAVSAETSEVNDEIQKDWADPDRQVDPNVAHSFAKEEPALD
ncbi:MAG TPA: hypothetical protein VLA89_05985 [Gemmatimonadales bacterium]|nr:hypothetical protein [Gemmatimonadales bacterium]